jgi:hypothetical protein
VPTASARVPRATRPSTVCRSECQVSGVVGRIVAAQSAASRLELENPGADHQSRKNSQIGPAQRELPGPWTRRAWKTRSRVPRRAAGRATSSSSCSRTSTSSWGARSPAVSRREAERQGAPDRGPRPRAVAGRHQRSRKPRAGLPGVQGPTSSSMTSWWRGQRPSRAPSLQDLELRARTRTAAREASNSCSRPRRSTRRKASNTRHKAGALTV